MEDTQATSRTSISLALGRAVVLAALVSTTLTGCSLFVMAGKMVFGDPKVPAVFASVTGTDLIKEEKTVLIVCSTPESIKNDFPSVDYDLLDGVARRLKSHGIKIVNPDKVATWLDRHGGEWDDPSELARDFETDYIVHIDIERFSYKEENSEWAYRGRTNGTVFVYEVGDRKSDDKTGEPGCKVALEVFAREYASVYPEQYPVPADRFSDKTFRKKYLDRVATQLAQFFYDHRVSDELE